MDLKHGQLFNSGFHDYTMLTTRYSSEKFESNISDLARKAAHFELKE